MGRGIEGHLSTYIDGSGALKHRVDNDDIVIRRTIAVDTLESDTDERGIWCIYRRARELKTVSLVSSRMQMYMRGVIERSIKRDEASMNRR